MATATLGGVIAAARRLSEPDSDAELLRRFAGARDEDAFAALVTRYGRLVLSACRRIVPDAHLADDAFQATFVVLATKANSLADSPDRERPLGPWLYAVACQVSVRARAMIGRRRKRETLTGTVPDTAVGSTGFPACADDIAVLDEEIGKLSAAYRDAVVLCELQGLSRKDAAKKLGIAEGTLSSRLAAARKALAARLKARGVVAGAISAVFVPTDLAAATVAVSTGKVELSTQLTTLVKGGLAMTFVSKLKLGAAVLAVAVLLFGVGGVMGLGGPSGDALAAPVPKEADPGLLWTHNRDSGKMTAYTPDGKKHKELTLPDGKRFLGLTSDGTAILFAGRKGKADAEGGDDGLSLHIRGITEKSDGTDTGLDYKPNDGFILSPDGKRVVRSRLDKIGGQNAQSHEHSHVLYDLATKKETKLDLPADYQVTQWSADGKAWRVLQHNGDTDPKLPTYRWLSVPVGGGKATPICDTHSLHWLDPSPDGRTFLAAGHRHPFAGNLAYAGFAVDAATGKATELVPLPKLAYAVVRWSPDGKRIAAMRYEWEEGATGPGDTRLVLYDASGKGEKQFLHFAADGQRTTFLGWFPTKPAPPDPRMKNAPVPKEGPDHGLIWLHDTKAGKLTAIAPDGKKAKELTLPDGDRFLGFLPDGSKIAFVGKNGKLAEKGAKDGVTVHLRAPSAEPTGTDTGLAFRNGDILHWSPDGGRVVRLRFAEPDMQGVMHHPHAVYDLATKKETKLELPANHYVIGWSADGKDLLLHEYVHPNHRNPDLPRYRVLTIPTAGGKPVPMCETVSLTNVTPTGVGRELFGMGHPHSNPATDDDATYRRWYRLDGKGKAELVKTFDGDQLDLRLAPDRKRAAFLAWTGDGEADTTLRVFDADGKAEQKVLTLTGDGQKTRLLGWFPTAPKPAAPPKRNAPVPKVEPREGVILVSSVGESKPLEVVKPDGTSVKVLKPEGRFEPYTLRGTAGGTRAVYAARAAGASNVNGYVRQSIGWLDLNANEAKPKTLVEEAYDASVACSAGGTMFFSHLDRDKQGGQPKLGDALKFETCRYDPATGTKTPLALPPEHAVFDISADGKILLTGTSEHGNQKLTLHLASVAELKPVKLLETAGYDCLVPRLSPDGKRVLYVKVKEWPIKPTVGGPFVLDVATGKEVKVPLPDADKLEDSLVSWRACWSPDGKRIALHWNLVDGKRSQDVAGRVTVFDADGSNAKTVLVRDRPGESITGLDWR